jgi:hypothetical protein
MNAMLHVYCLLISLIASQLIKLSLNFLVSVVLFFMKILGSKEIGQHFLFCQQKYSRLA